MTGRMYSERWGFLGAALVFAGFFVTFFPQFLLGNAGMPRRYYNYRPAVPDAPRHLDGRLVDPRCRDAFTLGYLIVALFTGERAPDNPWDSRSYEWLTPSPPPEHNFVEEPAFELDPYDYTTSLPRSTRDA